LARFDEFGFEFGNRLGLGLGVEVHHDCVDHFELVQFFSLELCLMIVLRSMSFPRARLVQVLQVGCVRRELDVGEAKSRKETIDVEYICFVLILTSEVGSLSHIFLTPFLWHR
jgi:hypothetical protein